MEEEDVQSYLSKHKISSLFEDLMSKVIKELPPNPIDFLIKKLQGLQGQKKRVSSQIPTITPSKISRGRIQVTGTSVASKQTKSPVSDHLSKSTSGLRPVKPKSVLAPPSVSPLSKTMPTRPSPSNTRQISSSAGRLSSKVPVPSKTTPKLPSRKPTRPVTAPSSGKHTATSIPIVGRTSGKGLSSSSKSKIPSPSSVRATSAPSRDKVKAAHKKTSDFTVTHKVIKPKPEEIDEFFGEAKKSSQKQFHYVDSEDEGTEQGVESDTSEDSDAVMLERVKEPGGKTCLDILSIRQKKYHGRGKKTRQTAIQILVNDKLGTPVSLGYHDDTESEETEDCVELLEDAEALRDEGVEITRGTNIIKTSSITLGTEEIVVCARCAKALGKSDPAILSGLDFESVSQVGSHTSFPQWEERGELQSSSAGQLSDYPASERGQETSSDITVQSCDTWGGLTPAVPPQPLHSDEESEVQLPPPPPLQGHSWVPDTPPQHDPYGWGQHAN